jgi:hypothetical protein
VRVAVVLRERDPEEPDTFVSEWVHEHEYSADDEGIRLDWGYGIETFFPWSSVLRVDWSPCTCIQCGEVRAAA